MIKKMENLSEHNNFLSFDYALTKVNAEIGKALSSPPALISQFTEYLGRSSGKNIRAKALLTCALNTDGMIHPDAVKFATATEVLHLATLIHDDVIDDADTRRGMPAFHKEFGRKTAVICGDYLLSMAVTIAASVENIKDYEDLKLPDYIRRICMGELSQHLNNYNYNLSIRKYLRIISGKTAALFQASFHAGIILGEKDHETVNKYLRLGRYIGMIFQLMDDCADFEEEEHSEKKPVQSDYEQGVITLPLIIAFSNSYLKNKAEKQELSRKEINDGVKKSGGISYTKLIAGKYYDKSAQIIRKLDSPSFKRKMLFDILNKAYRLSL